MMQNKSDHKSDKEIYLVTGAGGHLGGTVVRELLRQGKMVRAFLMTGEQADLPEEVEVFYGDVRRKESMVPFFWTLGYRKVNVIHCAGIVTIKSRAEQRVWDVNVRGTRNVLQLCTEYQVDRLVYVSSVHAIPELPKGRCMEEVELFSEESVTGPYAQSKAAATELVLLAARQGLDASVVHPSGIIGPYDHGNNHLTVLVQKFCSGKLPAGVEGGFDFVDVRDVAQGILSCVERGGPGRCYILSGHYASVREILQVLSQISGRKVPRIFLTRSQAKVFARGLEAIGEVTHRRSIFTAYSIETLGGNARYSNRRAREELGFTTRPLIETLKDTVKWIE